MLFPILTDKHSVIPSNPVRQYLQLETVNVKLVVVIIMLHLQKLLAVVDFLKPEIVELADRCSQVHLSLSPPLPLRCHFLLFMYSIVSFCPIQIKEWIQLMVPKIEDGNNFGVSVQVSKPS